MTDPARGPTTEELRARVLAQSEAARVSCTCGVVSDGLAYHTQACPAYVAGHRTACESRIAARDADAALLLLRPCLACNREQGERMCDLCQRLEVAEANREGTL